jgi:hypothetical protein
MESVDPPKKKVQKGLFEKILNNPNPNPNPNKRVKTDKVTKIKPIDNKKKDTKKLKKVKVRGPPQPLVGQVGPSQPFVFQVRPPPSGELKVGGPPIEEFHYVEPSEYRRFPEHRIEPLISQKQTKKGNKRKDVSPLTESSEEKHKTLVILPMFEKELTQLKLIGKHGFNGTTSVYDKRLIDITAKKNTSITQQFKRYEQLFNNLTPKFKLLITTHGSKRLHELTKFDDIFILLVNSITAAKSGCPAKSNFLYSTEYSSLLLTFLKSRNSLFTTADSNRVKDLVEQTEHEIDKEIDTSCTHSKKLFDERREKTSKCKFSTTGQEHRLFSKSFNFPNYPFFDKLFGLKDVVKDDGSLEKDKKPRGILFAEKFMSLDIFSNIGLLLRPDNNAARIVDWITTQNSYEYMDDSKLVDTATNRKYNIINKAELYQGAFFKKPLYVIITSDNKHCFILSEIYFDKSSITSSNFSEKDFKKIFGKNKKVKSLDEIKEIFTNMHSSSSKKDINCLYKLCYYEKMNLLVCPLLKLFLQTYDKLGIDYNFVQESMTKTVLMLECGTQDLFSTTTEEMVNKISKSTIMMWSKFCSNNTISIIDLSCSSASKKDKTDFDAISQHSQNQIGFNAKVDGTSLVGGKKTKKRR